MVAEIAVLFPEPEHPRGDLAAQRLAEAVRVAEALLFAAPEPMLENEIGRRLPAGVDIAAVMARLRQDYQARGIHLVRVGAKWVFRTADDLGWLLSASGRETKRLSRAAMETLAIIAYHQPATRAEIEDIRGVAVTKGTLDVLMETGWVRPRGRRRAPGRPITYGTTEGFLLHFALETIGDLPGLEDLRSAGLFDERLPTGFTVPLPHDGPLGADEDALDSETDQDPNDRDDLYEPEDELGAPLADLDPPDSLDRDPFV